MTQQLAAVSTPMVTAMPAPTHCEAHCRMRLHGLHRRAIAQIIGEVVGIKHTYIPEREGRYEIGGWTLIGGREWFIRECDLYTTLFTEERIPEILRVMDALNHSGVKPMDGVVVHLDFTPCDINMIFNAYAILESRMELLVKALNLPEPIAIVIEHGIAFDIPLTTLNPETLNALILLFMRVCEQAATVKRARMQPCDGSNPKFQMRTWLMRLGFIGEEYAAVRKVFQGNLDGNSSFTSAESKDRANQRRNDRRRGVSA